LNCFSENGVKLTFRGVVRHYILLDVVLLVLPVRCLNFKNEKMLLSAVIHITFGLQHSKCQVREVYIMCFTGKQCR